MNKHPRDGLTDRYGRYIRQDTDYADPTTMFWLNGTAEWDVSTGWDNAKLVDRIPVGEAVALEAVPEPGNPSDHTAVAVDIKGKRVGYLYRSKSATLHEPIAHLNRAGFKVMLSAKICATAYGRELRARASTGVDLQLWNNLPQNVRGSEYFELQWLQSSYQNFYQPARAALMIEKAEEQLFECRFAAGGRTRRAYGAEPGAPRPPEQGTYIDIYIGAVHAGEFRAGPGSCSEDYAALRRVYGGQKAGWARLQRWPNNIALSVAIPLHDGAPPRNNKQFKWNC